MLLAINSKGVAVSDLQTKLNALGYKLKVDGIFGKNTRLAVIDFQRKNKLVPDGIVGIGTAKALNTVSSNASYANLRPSTTKPTAPRPVQNQTTVSATVPTVSENGSISIPVESGKPQTEPVKFSVTPAKPTEPANQAKTESPILLYAIGAGVAFWLFYG